MSNLRDGLLDLPFARSEVDRDASARKDPELLNRLSLEPATKVLAIWDSKVVLNGSSLLLHSASDLVAENLTAYLGRLKDGSPAVLAMIDASTALALAPAESWVAGRKLGAGFSDEEFGLLVSGLALANWHASSGYCPKCSAETARTQAGWSRTCTRCRDEIFPRTDPAVIVGITDGQDRLLLGSQESWEENRWSVLAGFVEAGESLGEAVQREMLEECGLEVDNLQFLGSQAWPFPRSLMMAFMASAKNSDQLKPDGEEIVRLRFFSREEFLAQLDQMLLPGPTTISRGIIEHWLGAKIDTGERK